jgi:DSF synthase
LERVRTEIAPITRQELMQIVEIWASAALKLDDRDLRMMDRLVRAQQRTLDVLPMESASNVVPLQAVGNGD